MRIRIAGIVVSVLVLGWFGLALLAQETQAPATEQQATTQPKIVLEEIEPVDSLDGDQIYKAYCADCHGEFGRGDGRLAGSLGVEVPDLTRMVDDAGRFDRSEVRRAIARRHMVPVEEAESWYDVLVGSFGTKKGQMMLSSLSGYLETLQRPAED
jgi:cytochrome c1